eukprot:623189-Pyramimonas_sp.AAC.1
MSIERTRARTAGPRRYLRLVLGLHQRLDGVEPPVQERGSPSSQPPRGGGGSKTAPAEQSPPFVPPFVKIWWLSRLIARNYDSPVDCFTCLGRSVVVSSSRRALRLGEEFAVLGCRVCTLCAVTGTGEPIKTSEGVLGETRKY